MSKLPVVVWTLGFIAWMDVADYLEFLEGRLPAHRSDSYVVTILAFLIGGIALFWPWGRKDNRNG